VPAVPTSRIPTTELGRVASWSAFGSARVASDGMPWDPDEDVPDLQWPLSIATYNRMRRDGQVAAMLWAVTLPLRRPIWHVDPRGAREEVAVGLAEDLGLPLPGAPARPPARNRGRFSWPDHLRLALLSATFGHMAFEQVYEVRGDLAHLRKLAPRFPSTISHIDVAPDGGLVALRQVARDGRGEVTIPVERLVWYVLDREGANWQGTSLLRPCYKDWLLADRLVRVRAMTAERNGMGVPIAEAAEHDTQADVDALSELAQGYRSGEFSGGAVRHGQTIRFRGVEGTLPDVTEAVQDHRDQIAKRFMAQFLQLGTGGNAGNRALGEADMGFFARALDALAAQLSDTATAHIAEDWVDINYGPDEPAPAIVARAIDAETDIDPSSLVALIRAGAIDPDDEVQAWVRARYRVPAKAPAEVVAADTMSAEEMGRRVESAGSLIRSGFEPAAVVDAVGLAPLAHTGLLPVTIQSGSSPRPVAARRAIVEAATASTWQGRIRKALAAMVDAPAVATAAAGDGTATAAVDAGFAADPDALGAVLADLWAESYGDEPKVSATVRASLDDLLAGAKAAAAAIVKSLRSKLIALVAAGRKDGLSEAQMRKAVKDEANDATRAEVVQETEARRAAVRGQLDRLAAAGVTRTRWVKTTTEEVDACSARDGIDADWRDDPPPLHPRCKCVLEPA